MTKGISTAVIYARVSSAGDRQSTERQVKDLSDYAMYKKMEIRRVFEEHISGAKKNEERPVLCEAIEYCKEHSISTLLVSELSRMGRNAFEVLASVKELIDSGINLYIQKEQFNLLGDDGKPSLFAPVMLQRSRPVHNWKREHHLPLAVRPEAVHCKRGKIRTQAWFRENQRAEGRRIQGSHRIIEEGLCHPRRGETDRERRQHHSASEKTIYQLTHQKMIIGNLESKANKHRKGITEVLRN